METRDIGYSAGASGQPLRALISPEWEPARCLSCHNRMGVGGDSSNHARTLFCGRCANRQVVALGSSAIDAQIDEGVARCVGCHNRTGLDSTLVVGGAALCGRCSLMVA